MHSLEPIRIPLEGFKLTFGLFILLSSAAVAALVLFFVYSFSVDEFSERMKHAFLGLGVGVLF